VTVAVLSFQPTTTTFRSPAPRAALYVTVTEVRVSGASRSSSGRILWRPAASRSRVRVAAEIAGGIRGPDPVAVACPAQKALIAIRRSRHGGDLAKTRAPGPLAALHQVRGHPDIVGGRGPFERDLTAAHRRRRQVRWGRRGSRVQRRRPARGISAFPPREGER